MPTGSCISNIPGSSTWSRTVDPLLILTPTETFHCPLHKLDAGLLDSAGIELFVQREDLADPAIGGNKWRKLKYNLIAAAQQRQKTLLTFGGAWSNHIYATAAAGARYGFNTIGIIRGEQHDPLNPTLRFASNCGMRLVYVDRETYRNKTSPEFIERLHREFGRFYLLPEGGSNELALQGCAEIVTAIDEPFDIITVACGTGATLAGLVSALRSGQRAIGFAVLKGADFLQRDVAAMLAAAGSVDTPDWRIETAYHFGGYARTQPELLDFMRWFNGVFGIELDAVYTGKLFYGLFDQIGNGVFDKGSRIIAVHTGGLQGNAGFADLYTTDGNQKLS
jgi:1-aminocyclopropane-1-carboxylate deaminase/D-cysteine desulfhydrase-like pyridoxal-dependent ACC family enzyme